MDFIYDNPFEILFFLMIIVCLFMAVIIWKQYKAKERLRTFYIDHRNAEMVWEKLMMELVGEDGPGSVREAFEVKKEISDLVSKQLIECEKTIQIKDEALKTNAQTIVELMKFKDLYLEYKTLFEETTK